MKVRKRIRVSHRYSTYECRKPFVEGLADCKWLLILSLTQSCVEEPIKTEIALSGTTDKRTRVNKCCDVFLYKFKFECLEEVAHAPKPTFTINGI